MALAVIAGLIPLAAQAGAAPETVSRPAALGAITGLVSSDQGPLAHVTVTATRADGGLVRATVTDGNGIYSFYDLPLGSWTIGSPSSGSSDTVAETVQVTAAQAIRHDIALKSADAPPAAPAQAAPALAAAAAPSSSAPTVPEALQAPEASTAPDTITPLADVGYVGWMNGTPRSNAPIFDTKFFTPEIRFDANYLYSGNHPRDHTIDGSTEEFRSGEFQIEQVSLGGDFHWQNVHARFLSMFGLFSVTTPRNDASQEIGQWDLQGAYKYFSEANAGYHFDVAHGLNVDLGVFVSYIGLFSYYNYDNWTYQPSFVSSNTPWFFNGLRVQFWPTQHLKIEPWLINGWQSYAKFNSHPGFGGQILYIPNDSFKLVFNTYVLGQDNISTQFTNGVPLNAGADGSQDARMATTSLPGTPYVDWSKVQRIHEDDSVLVKYYDSHGQSGAGISRAAFSFTFDIGCQYGGGVSCTGGPNKESFIGAMLYNRIWWDHNVYAITFGGGAYTNPGRYLALTPPINGATAASGTPYFSQSPGLTLKQWDVQLNFQYMPRDWITWWTEATFRHSSVPYWSGANGITAPGAQPAGSGAASGPFTAAPGSLVCNDGTAANASACANDGGLWQPDLRTREVIIGAGVMVKF